LRRQFFNCHSCGLPIVPAGEWAVLKDAGKTHIDCPHCKTENPV
jgi:DNA-directed RNA polymerase subunit RPC12/RpoP